METTDNNLAEAANEFKLPKRWNVFEDALNGWLQVPFDLLVHLNIQNQITRQSRRHNDQVYLHYGNDANVFLAAFLRHCYQTRAISWPEINPIDHGEFSPINNMEEYNY